jgi:hypothetical protein
MQLQRERVYEVLDMSSEGFCKTSQDNKTKGERERRSNEGACTKALNTKGNRRENAIRRNAERNTKTQILGEPNVLLHYTSSLLYEILKVHKSERKHPKI